MDWSFCFILLNMNNFLLLKSETLINFTKLLFSSIIMSTILVFFLDTFSNSLDYSHKFKAIYLILIVSFVGMFFLLSCYLLGILKFKNFKTN